MSTRVYAFYKRGASMLANEEIRAAIFPGLFEDPLIMNKKVR